ncbi:MAG: helix-turn-helix transcriptional regulator, partial [Aristaeellaceae bacterium]
GDSMTAVEWMQKTGVAYRLRKARGDAHMTERMAADALGVSVGYVEMVEAGKHVPSLHRAAQLAAMYGVSLDALVYGDDVELAAAAAEMVCPVTGEPCSACLPGSPCAITRKEQ